MRIGSVLVAPILADAKVVGVLEVFSSQPDNFMEPDTGTLQRVADVIGAMIYRPK
jgi:putative methionine-R-sulfoxide reductase with GAF domain